MEKVIPVHGNLSEKKAPLPYFIEKGSHIFLFQLDMRKILEHFFHEFFFRNDPLILTVSMESQFF